MCRKAIEAKIEDSRQMMLMQTFYQQQMNKAYAEQKRKAEEKKVL